MGRRTPGQLRALPPQRRHRNTPTLPWGAVNQQRTPAWLKGAYGQGMAEAARQHAAEAPKRRGARFCTIDGRRKRRYADEIAAARALSNAQHDQRRTTAHVREKRVYACEPCGGWHLTSLPTWQQPEGEAVAPVDESASA